MASNQRRNENWFRHRLSSICIYAVVICWCISLRGAWSLEELSEAAPIQQINGIASATVLRTFKTSSPSDLGVVHQLQVQQADGVSTRLTILAEGTAALYQVDAVGTVAIDGSRITSTVHSARDPQTFGGVNTTQPLSPYLPGDQQPTGRKLLEFSLTAAVGSQFGAAGSWASYPDQDFVQAVCIAAFARGFNQTAVVGVDPAVYQDCIPGPTTDQINALKVASLALNSSLNSFQASIASFQGSEVATAAALNTENIQLRNWSSITLERLQNDQKELNETYGKQQAINIQLASDLSNQTGQVQVASSAVAALAAALALEANQTSNTLAALKAMMLLDFSQFSAAVAAQGVVVQQDAMNMFNSIDAIRSGIADRTSLLVKWTVDHDMTFAQNVNFQTAFQQAQSSPNIRGNLLFPWTPDAGTAGVKDPTQLGPSDNHQILATLVIRAATILNSVPVGIETVLDFSCEIQFAVRDAPTAAQGVDMIHWLGPAGCDATWNSPFSSRCKCSFMTTERTCILQNTLGVPHTDALLAWDNGQNTVDTTTGCVSAGTVFSPAQGGLDGVGLTSTNDLANALAAITTRLTYQERPFQFNVMQLQFGQPVSFSLAVANATQANFYANIIPATVALSDNIAYAAVAGVALAYRFSYDFNDNLRALLDGLPPIFATQRPILYDRIDGQNAARGTEWSMMMYSAQTAQVSRMILVNRISTIQYAVGSNPPQIISDAEQSNAFAYLQRASFFQVNDLTQLGNVIFNAPQSELSAAPSAGWREFLLTYPMVSTGSPQTLSNWKEENGVEFDQRAGNNVPAVYLTPIDSDPASLTYGECIGPSVIGSGLDCLTREHYSMSLTGVLNDADIQGSLVMTAEDDVLTFSIAIPGGAIVEMLSAICAKVTVFGSSGDELVLRLDNPLASNSVIQVQEIGACPSSSEVIIPAGGFLALREFVCPLASKAQPDQLVFSYQLQNILYPCPASTVNLTTSNGVFVPSAMNYTIQLNTVSGNTYASELAQLTQFTLQQIALTLQFQINSRRETIPFRLPNTTLPNYSNYFSALDELIFNMTTQTQSAQNETLQLSEIDAQFEARTDALQKTDDDLIAQANAASIAINTSSAALNSNIAELAIAARVTDAAGPVLIQGTIAFTNGVQNAMAEIIAPDVQFVEQEGFGPPVMFPGGSFLLNDLGYQMATFLLVLTSLGVDAVGTIFNTADTLLKDTESALAKAAQLPILSIIITALVVGVIIYVFIQLYPYLKKWCKKGTELGKGTIHDDESPGLADIGLRIQAALHN